MVELEVCSPLIISKYVISKYVLKHFKDKKSLQDYTEIEISMTSFLTYDIYIAEL